MVITPVAADKPVTCQTRLIAAVWLFKFGKRIDRMDPFTMALISGMAQKRSDEIVQVPGHMQAEVAGAVADISFKHPKQGLIRVCFNFMYQLVQVSNQYGFDIVEEESFHEGPTSDNVIV